MRIQSLSEAVCRFERLLLDLKGTLADNSSEPLYVQPHDITGTMAQTNLERLDGALRILKNYSGVEIKTAARLRKNRKANEAIARQARLQHLDRMIMLRGEQISGAELEVRQARLEFLEAMIAEMAGRISVIEVQVRQARFRHLEFEIAEKSKEIRSIEAQVSPGFKAPVFPVQGTQILEFSTEIEKKPSQIKHQVSFKRKPGRRGQYKKTKQHADSIISKLPIRLAQLSNTPASICSPSPDLSLTVYAKKAELGAAVG
jgi:hypothetical protein